MKNRFLQIVARTITTFIAMSACQFAFAQVEPLLGTVINKAEKPIEEVQVILRPHGSTDVIEEHLTDEDGTFSIAMESLRPGYELHFHKDGYTDVTLPISPQQLVVASISVIMQPTFSAPPSQPAKSTPTPSPTPSLVTSEQRKKAVELYNKGVEA